MPRIKKEWYPIETAPMDTYIIVIKEGVHPEFKKPFTPVIGKIINSLTFEQAGGYTINLTDWATHWMPCPDNPC